MEIDTLKKMQKRTIRSSTGDYLRIVIALIFMVAVLAYSYGTYGHVPNSEFLAIGAVFGAYMAMNIGANDVANNVGPAVGSKAMTLAAAIAIAAIFEASGALIAGGEVVSTIKKGIIDPAFFVNADQFIWAMTAALLAGGLWLNLATYLGAPVSTTHSIVGGVMGAGIAAAGFGIVAWGTMGTIAASWVISPLLGGLIAAAFLFAIKRCIIYQDDKILAAKKMVPLFVALMAWAFTTYLMLKGVKHLVKVDFITALGIGAVLGAAVFWMVRVRIAKKADKLQNSRESVNRLFTIPLVFAAALLSFAHGANDVANAIGPLAAIADTVMTHAITTKAAIPLWVMLVGALGIALGLALYGPKLIRTVGSEITELDQVRAFSIAMAAAVTVIVASQLGLPVSSTHIALGGVFGVGFLREYLSQTKEEEKIRSERALIADEQRLLERCQSELAVLELKEAKSQADYERIVELYKMIDREEDRLQSEQKILKQVQKIKYVKRGTVKRIVAAWIITVPAAAVLAALIFYIIKGLML